MTTSSRIDDEREEHRMCILQNDWPLLRAQLIHGIAHGPIKNKAGILDQFVHDRPYTITLYALLEHYGMTPVSRIKPRVRIRRTGGYDDFSATSPVLFPADARVDFAELKHGKERPEEDGDRLQRIFSDGPVLERLVNDPPRHLVAQHDLFLMRPPVKTKTKLFSLEKDGGIPLNEFLEALNSPKKASAIFKKYSGGHKFARDIRAVLEPYEGLAFTFGLYSRYQRWDCTYSAFLDEKSQPYRTTFDPFTVLGWVKATENCHQLQPLASEHWVRWEHKINPDLMDKRSIKRIAEEIDRCRSDFLISRCLSKSKTAGTLLRNMRESRLALINELPFAMTLEKRLRHDACSDISERTRLHAAWNDGAYALLDEESVQSYENLGIGRMGTLDYVHDTASLSIRPRPLVLREGGAEIIIQQPLQGEESITSAGELRENLSIRFDECFSTDSEECGYIIEHQKTGRAFTVSFGTRRKGSITPLEVDHPKQYLSVRYLGIAKDRYRRIISGSALPISFDRAESVQKDIVQEMQGIVRHLAEKKVI